MITKERLLVGLHEFIYVEEGLIALYANFSRVLVKHAGDIEKEKKEKIDKATQGDLNAQVYLANAYAEGKYGFNKDENR